MESKWGLLWHISINGYLVFKTTPDNATVPEERLRITSDGKIGIDIQNPVARLHVHNSGTGAGDHAYAHFTTGDTGSTITDGLTVGIAANQVASVNYREAGTLSLNTSSTPRITILSDGKVGVNGTPDHQFTVKIDGLSDNSYGFKTSYRSGNNASGYTASGITIVSSANDSNGDQNTAYLQFSNRSPALNGSHGASAFITMSTPDAQGTYGTGEFNFYCRNGSAYGFPNDPQVSSGYWMSSLFKIKSTGELFSYGNLRIDTGTAADGIVGRAYGTAYFGLKHADQSSDEYMMISNDNHTYISCTSGNSIYIRPSANSSSHETIFAHDNTTFKSNIIMDNHQLRRNQHHKGHMEGGYNNIGASSGNTSPIYTIGSSYNPDSSTLSNMYGIGYSHGNASFTPSGVGWGMYVAADGDARIFLDATSGNLKFNGGNGAVLFTNGTWSGEHSTGKIQTHGTNMYFQNAGGTWQFRKTNGTAAANIASNGTYTASDLTFKKDVVTISNAVDTIKKLTGRSFTWKEDDTKSFGVIAQEVETVLPELVSVTEEPEGSKVEPSKMVNYPAFTGHFIEAIKELSAKVEALESEVNTLKGS